MKPLHLASLAWLLFASPALAGGNYIEPFEPIDAQAIIDACWEGVDLKDQSISLEVRKQEVFWLENCHESAILRLMEPMFDPDLFSQDEAKRLLMQMHHPIFEFYAYILASHRKCDCGADAELGYYSATLKRYEAILRGIEDVRDTYQH